MKYKTLPDSCKTLSKKTVKEWCPRPRTPPASASAPADTNDSSSCLWSGLNKYDYRQLTVSFKRFELRQFPRFGRQARREYMEQQAGEITDDKENKEPKNASVSGTGQEATAISYETEKKDSKGKSEDYRAERRSPVRPTSWSPSTTRAPASRAARSPAPTT